MQEKRPKAETVGQPSEKVFVIVLFAKRLMNLWKQQIHTQSQQVENY